MNLTQKQITTGPLAMLAESLNKFRTAIGLGTASDERLPNRFLALDWTGMLLRLSEIEQVDGDLQVIRTFKQNFTLTDSAFNDEIVNWLREIVAQNNYQGMDVVTAAPRRFVAFKLLMLPNVVDERLPEVVRLQSETLFPKSADELIIDFVAAPYTTDQSNRSVLVAAIPREHIELLSLAIGQAELNSRAIVVGELGLGPLVDEPTTDERHSSSQYSCVVACSASKVEYLVLSEGTPLLCYAAKAPAADNFANEISVTIERLLASLHSVTPVMSLSEVILCGTSLTQTRLHLPSSPDAQIRYVAAQTDDDAFRTRVMLMAFMNSAYRIDFLNPRKPVDQRLARTRQNIKIATAVAACIATAFLASATYTWSLKYRIAARGLNLHSFDKWHRHDKAIGQRPLKWRVGDRPQRTGMWCLILSSRFCPTVRT